MTALFSQEVCLKELERRTIASAQCAGLFVSIASRLLSKCNMGSHVITSVLTVNSLHYHIIMEDTLCLTP